MMHHKIFKTSLLLMTFIVLISSCNTDDLSSLNLIKLTLSSGTLEQPVNTPYEFKVEGDNGVDITDDVIFKVNGETIDSSVFTSSSAGDYEVKAYYNNFESNALQLKVVLPSEYVQKVMIEDYTATWCGYCPRVAHAIELCKAQSDKVVAVAVHDSDDFAFDGSAALISAFGISGLPKGRINRTELWEALEHEHLNQVLDKTGYSATLGLSIESQIDNNNIQANVKVGFATDFSNQLNLVLYLTENGLIHSQKNYTEFYGGVNPIVDFEHNDVLRALCNGVYGETILGEETVAGNIYDKAFTVSIPSSVENNTNLHLVAFVIDKSTGEVINVQEAAVGEEVGFR